MSSDADLPLVALVDGLLSAAERYYRSPYVVLEDEVLVAAARAEGAGEAPPDTRGP